MSENVSATELTSQYTAQVTADLERNTKEQERLSAEIAALQEQLAAQQRDHTVLVSIQQAIGAAPVSAEPSTLPASAPVPVPAPRATKKTRGSGASKRAQAKKTAPAPRRAKADKPASPKAEPEKTVQPTLVELIRGHLNEQSEPRSAAEIAASLGQTHPDRSVKTTVVRTTLEGLVAKSQAQRSKQGTSVFYAASAEQEQAAPQTEEQDVPTKA
ncbi:hypothetical protein B6E66_13595 [Streptomyces maremycinicus]|nr:hypothetical protein B6E66_13595 [Streptomyces sp. B9173]